MYGEKENESAVGHGVSIRSLADAVDKRIEMRRFRSPTLADPRGIPVPEEDVPEEEPLTRHGLRYSRGGRRVLEQRRLLAREAGTPGVRTGPAQHRGALDFRGWRCPSG